RVETHLSLIEPLDTAIRRLEEAENQDGGPGKLQQSTGAGQPISSIPESSGRPLTLYPLGFSTDLWPCRYLAVVLNNMCVSAGTWRSAGCLRGSVHGARPPRASSHLTHGVLQGRFDDGRRDSQYVRAGLADDDAALAGPRVGRASPAPTAGTDAALPD